tara:strand:- start:114 stop:362 length:249 start_codon:yes stop_codon:yes gene_type:complete
MPASKKHSYAKKSETKPKKETPKKEEPKKESPKRSTPKSATPQTIEELKKKYTADRQAPNADLGALRAEYLKNHAAIKGAIK